MKVVLPYHLGSGNKGCEGIARGIAKILKLDPSELLLHDITRADYDLDKICGLDNVGVLQFQGSKKYEVKKIVGKVLRKFGFLGYINNVMSDYYLDGLSNNDMVFITGGDIYCYEGAYILPNMIVKKAKERGIKTVLFGVSLEEKFFSKELLAGLKNYDLITPRESFTEALLNKYNFENTLYPDPAFSLESQECELPDYFSKKVVGINFSPYTAEDLLFRKNITNLITYIINNEMEVCLIPHVTWKEQDDRESMQILSDYLGEHVHLLDTEKMNYLQIRYAISKCSYFIGGRTHSVISAYCEKVPCIALGYSIKARGIAMDIGMPEYTVVDSKNLTGETMLVDCFITLVNDASIARIYEMLDDYKSRLNIERELFF